MDNTRERPAPVRFDRYDTSPRPPWRAAVYGEWIICVLCASEEVQPDATYTEGRYSADFSTSQGEMNWLQYAEEAEGDGSKRVCVGAARVQCRQME